MSTISADTSPANFTANNRSEGLSGLLSLVRSRRTLLGLTIVAGIFAQAGAVLSAALGAHIAGLALIGASTATLTPWFWMLGAAVLGGAIGRWWQAHVQHDFAFALIETLQLGIYDGLERAAPGYVLGHRTGDLASVATADAELMELFYAHIVGEVVGAVAVPIGALLALALIQPSVAAALLPILLLTASVPFWLARRAGEQGHTLMTALGRLNADVVEGIQGQRELTIFGQSQAWLQRLTASLRRIAAENRRYGSRSGLEQAATDVLLGLAVAVAALTGVSQLNRGQLSIADLALVMVLAGAALLPLTEVTQTARRLGELKAGAARILAILRQPSAVEDRGEQSPPASVDVQFQQVTFGYSNARGSVLRGLDLEVHRGETVALVGRSGAGKSTCVNLLLRFWDPDSGSVRIGGVDLRDLPIATLRRIVGVVPQDVHLFHESVMDNIRLGRPQATAAEVEQAARLAQAHEFICALPQGYDTVCGERGARLSGGQRQRIAIARAFLSNAPILVMDEAVASLDTESERALQLAMERLRQHRAVLIIAHRLSTIRSADRIVVLEEGRIVEQGTHEQLLANAAAYARLIAHSAAEETLSMHDPTTSPGPN